MKRILIRQFAHMSIFIGLSCFLSAAVSANNQHLVYHSQSKVFRSDDAGNTWIELPVFDSINPNTYITASARHPTKPHMLLLGTSFEGIYESIDSGKTWKMPAENKALKPLYQGSGFYDEVTAIAYTAADSTNFAFSIGFNGGNWFYDRKLLQTKTHSETITHSVLPTAVQAPFIDGADLPLTIDQTDPTKSLTRKTLVMNRRGIYLNPNAAVSPRLERHLDFVARNSMNSIIIDFKDDSGYLTYASKLPLAISMKAVKPRIDAENLIKKAHAKNIAVVARIVVFKDKQLALYNQGAWSLWDKRGKKPWGVWRQDEIPATKPSEKPQISWTQTEWWVDQYADFVHQYNIELAKEIQALGVDEIQFDYIRFPSDGDSSTILARHHLDNQNKQIPETSRSRVLALAGFLAKARDAISIPVSVDVFGFNGWARMNYLGQDIQVLSRYVDVICPMAYPSHYPREFLPGLGYLERASQIYKEGTRRSNEIAGNRALIRPYVQAFLIGGELKFNEAVYYDYLNRQIISAQQGGGSGFTLWNNSGIYYMVQESIFKNLFKS